MKTGDRWAEHVGWIQELSRFLGCPLSMVEGSESVAPDAASWTLEGSLGAPSQTGLSFDLVVKLQATRVDSGDLSVWALVFFFVDKRRVAEEGSCFLSLEWRMGAWRRKGWEADVHGEWGGLETLDD
ncbi:hypothetical protein LY474_27710 [Myxococcus stipitatus]|uniref:hypothetical protein n=1 Tax=Myxococcus stipitatus TaxID=83455 RepID=UPI001F297144|nr:hypothetical protein [Myxococcus stipitatus]MCE9671599.1 hypothetical protein [Myxococcus stipitatus]